MSEAASTNVTMDKLVSLCKRRGFIFQSSEIYGGQGGAWDYGPLGVELKNNVKRAWWKAVVQERDDMVGLDSAILMHPRVWEASGHLSQFADPMVDCKECKHRFRADEVVQEARGGDVNIRAGDASLGGRGGDVTIRAGDATQGGRGGDVSIRAGDATAVSRCPNCGAENSFTEPRMFNLMFKTFVGPVEEEAATVYLRPETAQGIFVNFLNVLTATRRKLPFGIAQIGKAFRNEITPGNFTFRSREFEQMEIEFFVRPGTDEEWHRSWIQERVNWYIRLGMNPDRLRLRPHGTDELSHYSKGTTDVEYLCPWGWAEMEGIANRTDYDLSRHSQFSGEGLTYFDPDVSGASGGGEHITPYVIEPSAGVDRSALFFLLDAYEEETVRGETRVILRLHKDLAPMKVAVLPLSRNEQLIPTAQEVYGLIRKHFMSQYDDAQSIGRRYRRQDEIGTPYCVTIDFQTLEDRAVTIRDRDTMEQIRIPIPELVGTLREKLEG